MTPLKKVLVVDDDPVVGRSFERVLSGKGYAVITARDGEEALHKLDAEAYDVVFTDIRMPGMSGLEVAERVKASQPWLPVVIVTGYGTEENEARAEAAGVTEFLRKPLSPEAIEGSAEKVLHERIEQRQRRESAARAHRARGYGRSGGAGRGTWWRRDGVEEHRALLCGAVHRACLPDSRSDRGVGGAGMDGDQGGRPQRRGEERRELCEERGYVPRLAVHRPCLHCGNASGRTRRAHLDGHQGVGQEAHRKGKRNQGTARAALILVEVDAYGRPGANQAGFFARRSRGGYV